MAGIRGVTTGNNNAVPVVIDSNGQLGTISSSQRFKEDIHDMADASNGLLNLRPVTFRYTKPYEDGSKPLDYGLIAEEVAEVYPDLVVRGSDGQVETVQYHKLTPMLLNELQKQNATISAQSSTVAAQKEQIRSLEERLARLEALLQGLSTPAAR
jgi:polyhydroxyalkanoate synthesis regulator phasin